MKKFTWTVEFTVNAIWVADGFHLTDEIAKDMLAENLHYAHDHEISAKVIKTPDEKAIRKVQGEDV